MDTLILIGELKSSLRRVLFIVGVVTIWTIVATTLWYLLLACDRPLRQWSGRPAEEFAADREACYQTSMDFEECMKGKSWKIYEGEQ